MKMLEGIKVLDFTTNASGPKVAPTSQTTAPTSSR